MLKEEQVLELTEIIKEKLQSGCKRLLIGIGGYCGSGKSTAAQYLEKVLKEEHGFKNTFGLSMDGYHFPKHKLDEEGIKRRGAHWTFDASAFASLVGKLLQVPHHDVRVNGWSHEKGDPDFDALTVPKEAEIILIEGLHLFLDISPWNTIPSKCDICIWIDVDLETALLRLEKRHVATGLSRSIEEARLRIQGNDRLNAQFLKDHRLVPENVINLANS